MQKNCVTRLTVIKTKSISVKQLSFFSECPTEALKDVANKHKKAHNINSHYFSFLSIRALVIGIVILNCPEAVRMFQGCNKNL